MIALRLAVPLEGAPKMGGSGLAIVRAAHGTMAPGVISKMFVDLWMRVRSSEIANLSLRANTSQFRKGRASPSPPPSPSLIGGGTGHNNDDVCVYIYIYIYYIYIYIY